MSRKVFTCFIVISLFLNKAASYGQEIQVSRDTVKVSVQEGNTSPHNERSITPKPLDIRKAVDLSSGSCPSRITFDVQNPYNPTFPTDKSPLHEGEYSTSGIIKKLSFRLFLRHRQAGKLHRLGNNELCRYRICVFSRLLVIQLAGIYRKMECPQTRESAIGIVRAVDISRQRENSSKHICLILLHSFFSFQFLELRGIRFL